LTKFNNRKTVVNGITFDSKKEAARYAALLELEKAGKISDLEMQKKYELIPSQRINGKVVERAISYIADFVYTENGETVVEDVKGYRNPQAAGYAKFVIKRKLMLYIHGIRVREI
jgi:hypothetical protein